MKLLKFNLLFIPILVLCLGAVGYTARNVILEDARQHVIQNARIMMETALPKFIWLSEISRTSLPTWKASAR